MLYSDEVEQLLRVRKARECRFENWAAEANWDAQSSSPWPRLCGKMEYYIGWLYDQLIARLHKDELDAIAKAELAERRLEEIRAEAARQAVMDGDGNLLSPL